MMKRYLLFTFYTYYPSGGWDDFVGSYRTIEEARTEAHGAQNWQIIDSDTGEKVEESQ